MGLFGSKPAELATNAPRHWRRIPSGAMTKGAPDALNSAIVSGLVLKGLEEDGIQFTLEPFASFLYEDGVLRVPAIIREPNARSAVFAYQKADAAAAAHYSAVRGLLRQREQITAVYYAPAPMNPAPGGKPLEPLDVGHFVRDEEEREPAEYALWWPTAEEPLLSASPALAHLDAWFAALDGIGSYLFSAFVSRLQLAGEGAKEAVYALPASAAVVAVDGPGALRLYLSASAEEGLWLAVETTTPAARRNVLLKLLAELAARFRATVLEHEVPLRDEDRGPQLAFWRRTRGEALAAEREEGLRVGLVSDAGMKARLPGASTAAQRTTTPNDGGGGAPAAAAPSDGLVTFADAQLKVACARIAERAGQGGDEPNLHPFVAVRLADRTECVTLSMFEEPEAYARAPRLIAERPGATMAVVACDGVVRLGNERFDAVRLRVHERGTPRSFEFFQRYRLGQRLEIVGNWALSGTAEPLFPQEAPAPALGEPPVHARATLEKRLADLLEWLSVGAPPGLEPHLPLFSPSLHTLDGGHWRQARFVMGNEAWAESSSEAECASEKQAAASVAVFETDELLEVDGREARRFRFRVHHRGDARSWVFVQPYAMPRPGRPFATVGGLALLGTAEPLLPGPAPAAAPRSRSSSGGRESAPGADAGLEEQATDRPLEPPGR